MLRLHLRPAWHGDGLGSTSSGRLVNGRSQPELPQASIELPAGREPEAGLVERINDRREAKKVDVEDAGRVDRLGRHGDLDVVVADNSSPGFVNVRFNDGLGNFGGGSDVPAGFSPTSVALADLDGDGDLDLLASSYNSSAVSVRINTGSGQFTTGSNPMVGGRPQTLALGDVDGDGDIDIITGQYNNDKLNWYENLGGGNFGPEQIIYNPGGNNGSLTSLRVADMDGDGDLDFIVSSYNSYTNYYKNNYTNYRF